MSERMKRNFFLMKQMGLCTRGGDVKKDGYYCVDCGAKFDTLQKLISHGNRYRQFNNWEEFGELYTWFRMSGYMNSYFDEKILNTESPIKICENLSDFIGSIDPDRFANVVYEYLKTRQK